jgi:D-alanyl-D-alanine dipeptidase
MIDDRLDVHLDNILKASGSALKHYSMQKIKDDMRQALRQAIAELESQEPVCPECKAEVLYECVACSRNNYPPQRKPLTDEQILNVARDHYNPHQRPEISFARAIEAAHGIKE